MKKLFLVFLTIVVTFIIIIGIMITIPPPKFLPKLESIAAPFRSVDFSNIPNLHYYRARDGTRLAYREYLKQHTKQIVVLIYGSFGSSLSMYPLAEYLENQDMTVYSLDLRGHGNSARKGDITVILNFTDG
jgi:non-heme chloroperoxidase